MAITAAQLLVKVQADTKDAESGLKGISKETDKAHGFLKNLGSTALGTFAGFLGAQGASNVMGFLTSQIGDAISSGKVANTVMAQTAAVLKSTHDASGMSAKSIGDFATHMMNLTGIDDTAVQGAENMLATFTNIHQNVFPQTSKAVLDMATAMNGGAVPSAEQLRQTAIQVGKALNDPIQGVTALQRVGVKLSDTQKEQVKHFMAVGNSAGAQNVILKELNKEFGGSAQAAGKANGGMAIMTAQMDNAKQKIGQALIPAITQLVATFAPLVTQLAEKLTPIIVNLTGFISKHKEVVIGLAAVVGTVVVGAFAAWAVATIAATWPILAITAGVGLLVAGFIHFKPQIDAVVGAIGQRLKPVIQAAKHDFDIFGGAVQSIIGFIGNLIGKIGDLLGSLGRMKDSLKNVPVLGGLMQHLPHFASGGTMGQSGLALVGEHGPELVRMPGGTQVYSHAQTAAMFSSGRGMPMTVHVHVHPQAINLDGYQIAQTTVQHLPDILRSGTGVREF